MTKYKKLNKGYAYFLLVIDVVSRFIWGEPMKTKEGPETKKAFETILKTAFPRHPEKLQTDDGREFFNKNFSDLMKKNNINHYSTESDQKAAIAERAIKTIKELINKLFTSKQSHDWVTDFQDLITTYNNTYHSTIKMKPSEVTKKSERGFENLIWFHMGKRQYKIFSSKKTEVQYWRPRKIVESNKCIQKRL